jgi:dTDP-4-amino-4,6-dideoxygalactose transaminase
MKPLKEIATKHDLVLIEDACQSHGAKLGGKPVGSWGTACYSFYPTKNMTTIEGGMITTNDPDIVASARLIRNHGSPKRYLHDQLGFNFRMTDLQAAIGLVQLDKLDGWTQQRQKNAHFLTSKLENVEGVTTPKVRPDSEHVFHQYTLMTQERDKALDKLNHDGIGVGVYYPIPIHQQPLYQGLGYSENLPVSEKISQKVLSLPVHPALTEEELDMICVAVERL